MRATSLRGRKVCKSEEQDRFGSRLTVSSRYRIRYIANGGRIEMLVMFWEESIQAPSRKWRNGGRERERESVSCGYSDRLDLRPWY